MKKLSLFFVAMFTIIISHAQTLPNPLAHWTFNDSSAVDSSGYAYNGVANGLEYKEGINCTPGAYFNGQDSYINYGDILDDVFSSNVFSISLWVKPESYKSIDGTRTRMILSKWHSSGGPTDNAFILYTTHYCAHNRTLAFPALSLHDWQHIVVSNDTGHVSIYMNNIKVAEDTGFISNVTDYSLYLGSYYLNGLNNYKGTMDDVRIYRQALTEAQVNKIYSASPYSELLMEDQAAFADKEVTLGVDDVFQAYSWSNGATTPAITVLEDESAIKGYRLTVTDDKGCIMSDSAVVSWFEPGDNLAAYWNFNDGSANDLSGNGIDGTISSAAPADTGVKCSNSLYFNGDNSKIDFGNVLGDVFTDGDFTISLWARMKDTIDVEDFDGFLIQKWHSTGSQDNTFILYTYGFRTNNIFTKFIRPGLDKWNHYVVVNKEHHVTVYINNLPVASSFNNQYNETGYQLMIGALYNDKYNFEGFIDEVKIYDRSLGVNEISDLYQNGFIQPLNRLTDQNVDAGEDVVLDAGSGFDEYLWSTEQTTQVIQLLDIMEDTLAWVMAKDDGGCYSDTIQIMVIHPIVEIKPLNRLSDLIINSGEDVILDAGTGFDEYLWSTEDTTMAIQISNITETIPMVWVIATNNEGCYSDTISITVRPTAISDMEADKTIIFPNPVGSKLYMEFNVLLSNVKIEVFDLTGKQCINREYHSIKEIGLDVSSYQKGTYILKIDAEGESSEFKFVIDR